MGRHAEVTAEDPMRDLRGDGGLYDYCVDDPVTCHDPNGLWWRPWDESRVPRDKMGRFGSNKGGEKGLSEDAAELYRLLSQSADKKSEYNPISDNSILVAAADSDIATDASSYHNSTMPWEDPEYIDRIIEAANTESTEPLQGIVPFEPSGRYTGSDAELTFVEALVHGLGNFIPSANQFFSDLLYAAINYEDTGEALKNIVTRLIYTLAGKEHDSRRYSEAVATYFINRYGSWAKFKETLATDPVGLAADLSAFISLGGGAVRGTAAAARVAGTRALPAAGRLVERGVTAASAVEKVERNTVLHEPGSICMPERMEHHALPGAFDTPRNLVSLRVRDRFTGVVQAKLVHNSGEGVGNPMPLPAVDGWKDELLFIGSRETPLEHFFNFRREKGKAVFITFGVPERNGFIGKVDIGPGQSVNFSGAQPAEQGNKSRIVRIH